MEIDIVSDIHFDSWQKTEYKQTFKDLLFSKKKSDVLVIAGDIAGDTPLLVDFVNRVSKDYIEVFVTLGNHDYWSLTRHYKEIQQLVTDNVSKNVHILDNTPQKLDKYVINGCFGGYGKVDEDRTEYWQRSMNDCKYFYKVDDYREILKEELAKIDEFYAETDIVVTHTFPMFDEKYVANQFKGSLINDFFRFDYEPIIKKFKKSKKLWIFGHQHTRRIFSKHNVTFVNSAVGYPIREVKLDTADKILPELITTIDLDKVLS